MKIYLASPYSGTKSQQDDRYVHAVLAAGYLINEGHHVFSPIVHCHPISLAVGLPGDFNYWQEYDKWMLSVCEVLYLLMIDEWNRSAGMKGEFTEARQVGKTVYRMVPSGEGYLVDEIRGEENLIWMR